MASSSSSNTASKTAQPEWHKPVPSASVLRMNNSMTHTKTEFVPASGRRVGWYTCGPTVYDQSHLGHARTYVSFDVIRRIMEDYFNYDVTYVMNITDIDDKIILAARRKYLFDQKLKETAVLSQQLVEDAKASAKWFSGKHFAKYNSDPEAVLAAATKNRAQLEGWVKQASIDEPKVDMRYKMLIQTLDAVSVAQKNLEQGKVSEAEAKALLQSSKDTLSEYLDATLKETVTDPTIFRDFAAYWEEEYFKDMDALNIRRPDVLTRVSEYVQEIIDFVEKIISNGYAYESQGSVYFDTLKFDRDPNHFYAKLEPWSASNMKLLEEGEGDLATTGKKNSSDFALWKASKPGEPAWQSPWGKGRPGWHIECSAMAGDILGEKLDIHAGGIDLAFPHHDNEIAQSEGHYNCKQWVNYFLHTGHLHIEGLKMSKSLKNFVTISDMLKKHTASQIRILFLLNAWDSTIDFKESSFNEADVFEKAINNFMVNSRALIQEARASPAPFSGKHNFNSEEKALLKLLEDVREKVHESLCDNFNTSGAMNEIRKLITESNNYIKQVTESKSQSNTDLILKIAKYITKLMRIFGVYPENGPEIGFNASQSSVGSAEDVADPYVRLLASYRDKVREMALKKADHKELLELSDKLRDEQLVELNVHLDDRTDGRALVKFVKKEDILKLRAEKEAAAAKAKAEKEARRLAEEAKKAELLAKSLIKPEEMFRDSEGVRLYSQWDERGIPTHTIDGQEVSKSSAKKLLKQWEEQRKRYEKTTKSG